MNPFTRGSSSLCLLFLFVAAGIRITSGDVPANPVPPSILYQPLPPNTSVTLPPAGALTPEQQKALNDYGNSLHIYPRALPDRSGPSANIPPCYMVYGYGTDANGKGPFLDISGHALPIGQEPRLTPVWRFQASSRKK